MALAPGTRLGVYEVTAQIGAGGMGEVYRATDTKLKRQVAIKVLPPSLAADHDRLARFQREAEVLASLNHPNIAAIYGLEESAGMTALVMELVEGEDLSQRIASGAIPLDEALPIAKQIAEALEAAHEQGIIHRDLKPANVKVRAAGTVKVLDYGLAKAMEPAGASSADAMNSPTLTARATQMGMILGTAAYMAPEQAKGKSVDKRADIWAFGCVLYEMLTGCKAFDGADLTDTLVSVVSKEPDWSQLPAVTPPAIGRLLRRCIVKDRRSRLPDIAVARLDIDEALTAPASVDLPAPVTPVRGRAPWREGVAWATAAVSIVAAFVVVTTRRTPALPPPTPLRFAVDPLDGVRFYVRTVNFFAVSPDGHHLAYIGQDDEGTRALWLHSFREGTARLLANTTGAGNAFWSRDGRFIAFQAGGKLRKVEIVSGAIQTICDLTDGAGLGTWNRDDAILISEGVLYRVSAQGGTPQAITKLDEGRGDVLHTRPHFLPDGRHFLFSAVNRQLGKSVLRIGELGSTETRDLGVIASGAEYVAPGYLVYAVGARLIARPFEAAAGDWAGEPTVLSERVRQQTVGRAAFSASPNGVLVFDDATLSGQDVNLMWVNRDGTAPRTFATIYGVHAISLASNDQVAAVELTSGSSGAGVWLLDARRGTRTRFTFESGTSQGHPVWSPDRTRVVYFDGQPSATSRLLVKGVTGTREAEPLVLSAADTTDKYATDWSADGRIVLFEENSPATGWDLRYVRLDGDRTASAVLQSRFAERQGQLSPDGRYLAYVSDESGQDEIYVTTFPGAAEKWAISSRGGTTPRWRRDGRELLFIDPKGTLQSVAILTGARFQADVPKPQFALNPIATDGWSYAISQDGKRLLVAQPAQAERSRRIFVLTNWPHRMTAPR